MTHANQIALHRHHHRFVGIEDVKVAKVIKVARTIVTLHLRLKSL
jgi:hypothetical protein